MRTTSKIQSSENVQRSVSIANLSVNMNTVYRAIHDSKYANHRLLDFS